MFAVQTEPLRVEASSTELVMVLSTLFDMSEGVGSAPVSIALPVGSTGAEIEAAVRAEVIRHASEYGLTLPPGNIVTYGYITT